jgi:hypothetical protein
VGCSALFAIYLRISLSSPTNSDEASIALQGWDLIHGHLLLHGWILSDAAFYTLEMPLYGLSELLFGVHDIALNVAATVWYELVTVCVAALAMTSSHGRARLARCAIAVTMMAMPLLVLINVRVTLGSPDHMGTTAFLLVSFLLIDRAPDKRYTAPLVGLILFAGELGDDTVRYIAVPAIVGVCGYRMVAARRIRGVDGAIALAAVVSVPLEYLVRAVMRHLGAFQMEALTTQLASPRRWPHNATLTFHAVRQLFGAVVTPNPLGAAGTVLGSICALAALVGLIRTFVTWRSASRAEQFLALTIVVNIAAYQFSTMPQIFGAYEMSAVLPCGAVLAARTVVPARIRGRMRARTAVVAAGLAALLPLGSAATVAPATGLGNTPGSGTTLISWLEAHHLSYGLASYWNSSAITVLSGNKVAVRTIGIPDHQALMRTWETDAAWFDPSKYDATFVVVQPGDLALTTAQVIGAFGQPASVAHLPNWEILIYHKNLLRQVYERPLGATQ